MSAEDSWADLAGRPLRAEIVQAGRWRYAITINEGLMVTDPPWHRMGFQRAKRKAQRELRRWTRREQRRANRVVVDGQDVVSTAMIPPPVTEIPPPPPPSVDECEWPAPCCCPGGRACQDRPARNRAGILMRRPE